MSIEGITNYEYMNRFSRLSAWERLERIDYCDKAIEDRGNGLFGKIALLIKSLF